MLQKSGPWIRSLVQLFVLISDFFDFKKKRKLKKVEPIEFTNIDAGKYYIRIIYDSNQNGQYDSGSFLERRMPERVSYFPEELDVRAGWDLIQEFILK